MRPIILQLIDSFNLGGSERQAIQLTRLLHESKRFDVRLASLSGEGPLRAEVEALNLQPIPSFPLTSFYDRNAMVQLRRLMSFIKQSRIDVLHTHDFYTNAFGMMAGSFARVPARVASMRETAGMRSSAQRKAQQFAFAMAHGVVANSNAVRLRLIDQGIKKDKIHVIYNGLDVSRLAPAPSRSDAISMLGLKDENLHSRKFVTIVANMRHDVKDYPTFLRAAQLVKRAVPESTFLLAGEGELANELRALARSLEIMESTFFLGRCDSIGALLSLSEVCVLSSKAEGFANAILEYMAAGRPVVATDVGGAREAINDGRSGHLVQVGDYHTMASHIIALLREPDRARAFGEEGRKIVLSKFSCEAQLKQTEQLYDTLLAKRSTITAD